ncbi:MAG: 7-carboxy-7-deazaguanine synthase QueE, partial [Deltaproteobacteria bacterium]|nr:7-carboxy-7-deazaguanine synthase QueE [Deltaproteobacteria bacterium]
MYVAEIFESFHGEVNGHHQGRAVTFIRLSGCNLRCAYCDTQETWDRLYGTNLNPAQILDIVVYKGRKHVCITGGEPLARDKDELLALIHILSENGYRISVETNGTLDISPYAKFVDSFVIDYKVKGSLPFLHSNLVNLRKTDIIKFVVGNVEEVQFSLGIKKMIEKDYPSKVLYAFSP